THDLRLQPTARPELRALLEEREHELLLAAEVPIERHARDAGLLDDRVDADCADSVAREEIVGCREDALLRSRIRWALWCGEQGRGRQTGAHVSRDHSKVESDG